MVSAHSDSSNDYEVVYSSADGAKPPRSNAATGASAAGMRAFASQFMAFYFRAPIKAFFRTRVDYMVFACMRAADGFV